MPIAKPKKAPSSPKDAAADKADVTFQNISANRFADLPQTTETMSVRVPKGEKNRITNIFARHGLTRAEGMKRAIYELIEKLER